MIEAINEFFSSIGNFFNDIVNNLLSFLYDLFFTIIKLFFGWINVPAMPPDIIDSINTFLDLIFDNLTFIGFFIRPGTLTIVIPIFLFLINFEYIYKFTMWIVRKIPFLSMK